MLKVLVVDDALIMRKKVSTALSDIGHKVIGTAENGEIAIKMVKKYKPDLVTMDITMPNINGIVATKRIREFDKEVKIIMVTSHGQEEMVLKSLKEGAKGYLLKPVTKDKLEQSIASVFPEYQEDEDDCLLDSFDLDED